MSSKFADNLLIEKHEPVELHEKFLQDTTEFKIDSIVGVYRLPNGRPWNIPAVEKAEKFLATKEINHEYLWEFGDENFANNAAAFTLGGYSLAIRENRVVSAHTGSGSAALRIAGEYLVKVLKYNTIYLSTPTWVNHKPIFHHAGFEHIKSYSYLDPQKKSIDFEGWQRDLRKAPENSVVLLQVCAHNPTGLDPSRKQWTQIAQIIQKKNLFPLFDCAYGGLASGTFDEDIWVVRYFESLGFEFQCALSFSKNMGLYDERVGCLITVVNDKHCIPAYRVHLKDIIKSIYMCPPKRGATIANTVLTSSQLITEWKENIKSMVKHTTLSRTLLRQRLEELGTPGKWSHITEQKGLFSHTGLTPQQTKHMVDHHHIYMLSSGRLNISVVDSTNVDYLANAINDAVNTYPTM